MFQCLCFIVHILKYSTHNTANRISCFFFYINLPGYINILKQTIFHLSSNNTGIYSSGGFACNDTVFQCQIPYSRIFQHAKKTCKITFSRIFHRNIQIRNSVTIPIKCSGKWFCIIPYRSKFHI